MNAVSVEGATIQRKTRVFLSYSRKDVGFTRKLASALAGLGYIVDFDQSEHDLTNVETGISAEDDWWNRLKEMIASAEAMVLIVSPNSAASEVCGEEIAHARTLGKRVIPILLSPIDFSKAPSRLAALNVKLLFVDEASFTSSLGSLATVLDLDVAWHREGAQLTTLASRWDRDGRAEARLLGPEANSEAEAWAARRPPGASELSELLVAFLAAGRTKAQTERELLLTITGRAFVKPAETALAEGRHDAALRFAAAGVLLSQDASMRLVPERARGVSLAAEQQHLRCLLAGRAGHQLGRVFISGDERRVITIPYSSRRSTLDVRIWDPDDGREIASLPICDQVAFHKDSMVLATADKNTAWLWNAVTGEQIAVLSGHQGVVRQLEFSPDGAFAITSSQDGTARVWNARTGDQIAALDGHEDYVSFATFSPDGMRIATGSSSTFYLWDTTSFAMVASLRDVDTLSGATFDPTGKRFVTVDRSEKHVRVWDTASGRVIAQMDGRLGVRTWFSPTGKTAVTGSFLGGKAALWSLDTGSEIAVLRTPDSDDGELEVAFSPDGSRVVTGHGNLLRLWSGTTGREVASLQGHAGHGAKGLFSAGGDLLATTSYDGTPRIWEAMSGRAVAALPGHGEGALDVAFSADDTMLATASTDSIVRIWNTTSGHRIAELRGHEHWACKPQFLADGRRLVTTGGPRDPSLRIWDWGSRHIWRLDVRKDVDEWILSASDEARIATIMEDTVSLWDLRTAREAASIRAPFKYGLEMVFSQDARRFLIAGWDHENGVRVGRVRVFDTSTAREQIVLSGHRAAFSANGDFIATVSLDGGARIYDGSTGVLIALLQADNQPLNHVAFSPDGTLIATGAADYNQDYVVRVWQVSTGREILAVRGHEGGGKSENAAIRKSLMDIHSMSYDKNGMVCSFSPDGKRLVTLSDSSMHDRVARVWDLTTGNLMFALELAGTLKRADFSPDGARIVTLSYSNYANVSGSEAVLWDAQSGERVTKLAHANNTASDAAFSADGSRIVVACIDGAVVCDAATGLELAILPGPAQRARFNSDATQVVTASGALLNVWDVSRTAVLLGDPIEILAASLANGRGVRSEAERTDLLMQAAPDDLHHALYELLTPEQRERVACRVKMLRRPLHPNCYRNSTDPRWEPPTIGPASFVPTLADASLRPGAPSITTGLSRSSKKSQHGLVRPMPPHRASSGSRKLPSETLPSLNTQVPATPGQKPRNHRIPALMLLLIVTLALLAAGGWDFLHALWS